MKTLFLVLSATIKMYKGIATIDVVISCVTSLNLLQKFNITIKNNKIK